MAKEILIESGGRWDTLELVRRLPRCRWYLVEREARRWDVHVEAGTASLRAQVLDVADRWARSRHVRAVVHVPVGRDEPASGRSGFPAPA